MQMTFEGSAMTAQRYNDNVKLDAAKLLASTGVKAMLAGIALVLVLCFGALGAHASDPTPDNAHAAVETEDVVDDSAIEAGDEQGGHPNAGLFENADADDSDDVDADDVDADDVDGADDSGDDVEADDVDVSADDSDDAGLIQAVVAGMDIELVYDAEPHQVPALVLDADGQEMQDYFAVATTPSYTDVTNGAIEAPISDVTIYGPDGDDVTSRFDFEVQPGTITITPAQVVIKTPSASKVYDGTPLTAEDLEFELPGIDEIMMVAFSIQVTGSQTEIGESANTYTIDWGDVNPDNYQISETLGRLVVSANEAPIILTLVDVASTYSGEPLTSEAFEAVFPDAFSGYYAEIVAKGSQTDAGTSDNVIESYKIFDDEGNDVTHTFSNVITEPGKLTIEPAMLTVVTPNGMKPYNGTPLTMYKDDWIVGFVNGETATCTITGSQTEIGESLNTYSIVWDGTAKKGNYFINEELGILEVIDDEADDLEPVVNPAYELPDEGDEDDDNGSTGVGGGSYESEDEDDEPAYTSTTVVDTEDDNGSTSVVDTPNVTYLTPAASTGMANSANSTAASSSSSQQSASSNRDGDSASQSTDGVAYALTDGAIAEDVEEEVLYDDATPLASLDAPVKQSVSPWAILGAILFAWILFLLLLLLRRRRNDKGSHAAS